MARQIIWTISAQTERREILEYWLKEISQRSSAKNLIN
jgi:hypothetical protein